MTGKGSRRRCALARQGRLNAKVKNSRFEDENEDDDDEE